jgi:hypothetical protein
MMKIRKIQLILTAAVILVSSGYSLTFEVTQDPTYTNLGLGDAAQLRMETLMNAPLNQAVADLESQMAGFQNQERLAQGFANANAYSVHSANFSGVQNYKLFALGTGFMIGVQAPSFDPSYLGSVADDINENGDLYAGASLGYTLFNLGVNARFIKKGLYLNVKYGGMSKSIGDFSYDFKVMGIGANYALIKSVSALGLVKWRGISIGTGAYYQSNTIKMKVSSDDIKTRVPIDEDPEIEAAMVLAGVNEVNVVMVPEFDMGLDISTVTVPVDVVTSLSLIWGVVNVSVGAGFDLNFGGTDILLSGETDLSVETDNPAYPITETPGKVTINGSSDNGASIMRPRINVGIGTGIGPVRFEFPMTYYIASGVAFGGSAIIAW